MPTALIHVFTGTKNALRIARITEEKLQQSGYSTSLQMVNHSTSPPDTSHDLHLFTFPVYAMSAPHMMYRYMAMLPPGSESRAAVVCTVGQHNKEDSIPGHEGRALVQAAALLRKKGYNVSFTGAISYPTNITFVASTPDRETVDYIMEKSDEKVRMFADKIAAGTRSVRGCNWYTNIFSFFFGLVFGIVGRRSIGKGFVADSSCISCGKCVKECPADAISLAGGKKPRWNYRCEGCQRCINICPVQAIQSSWVRWGSHVVFMILWIIGFEKLHLFNYFVSSLGTTGAWVASIVFLVVSFFLFLAVLDVIVFGLESAPGIRKIFEWSFTGKNRRYQAPELEKKQ